MDQETKDKRARHAIETTLFSILSSQGESLDLRVRREVRRVVMDLDQKLIHDDVGQDSAITSLLSLGIGRPDSEQKIRLDATWESPRVEQIIRRVLSLGLPKDRDGD